MSINSSDFNVITSQYLYGSTSPPQDPADNENIRSSDVTTNIPVDVVEYMTTGAGRFAKASMSSLVEQFFRPDVYPGLPFLNPGTYTKEQLKELFNNEDFSITFQQWNFSDGTGDDGIRAYIWNSTAFQLGDVRFVVEENGDRHIDNLSVIPRLDVEENFDFVSGDLVAGLAADYLQERMDLSDIGRKVIVDFIGSVVPVDGYDIDAYYADVHHVEQTYVAIPDLVI